MILDRSIDDCRRSMRLVPFWTAGDDLHKSQFREGIKNTVDPRLRDTCRLSEVRSRRSSQQQQLLQCLGLVLGEVEQ